MMTSQPFAPIIVENQVINWGVFSGIAVGVQKYTKTHVSSASGENGTTYHSTFEIIIEFVIQQYDGEEIPVKLSTYERNLWTMNKKEGFEEIRLREGQRISVIGGYTDDKSSDCLIFINHNDKKWYWLDTYANIGKFLDDLGIFGGNLLNKLLYSLESDWWFFAPPIYILVFLFIVKSFDFFFFFVLFVICIEFPLFIHWKQKIYPSRQIIKLQIAEMARSLL